MTLNFYNLVVSVITSFGVTLFVLPHLAHIAEKIGLVDETGTKRDAILKAAELANISAESVKDIRVCPISTAAGESGLFSAEALVDMLQAKAGIPELKYQ